MQELAGVGYWWSRAGRGWTRWRWRCSRATRRMWRRRRRRRRGENLWSRGISAPCRRPRFSDWIKTLESCRSTRRYLFGYYSVNTSADMISLWQRKVCEQWLAACLTFCVFMIWRNLTLNLWRENAGRYESKDEDKTDSNSRVPDGRDVIQIWKNIYNSKVFEEELLAQINCRWLVVWLFDKPPGLQEWYVFKE